MSEIESPPPSPSGRNWSSYLFEFILLFLAVTLGFFVENIREYYNERNQEKDYMHQMVEDIDTDLVAAERLLRLWHNIDLSLDTLLHELSSPHVATNSNRAYKIWSQLAGYPSFIRNDRTIAQLKSNGLHLIKHQDVSDAIMQYDQLIRNIYSQQDMMDGGILDLQYYLRLFNFIELQKAPDKPIPLTETGLSTLNEGYERQRLWKQGLLILARRVKAAKEQAQITKNLIEKYYSK